jgi:NADH dehydrogenase FAD-containing subunit
MLFPIASFQSLLQDIGEGAIVLGQLLGYEDESERLAVLDAGLTVRGVEFANELAALTEEALEGFEQASARENVDAELVDRVRVIDDRIRKFIGRWTKDDFQ